MTHSYLATEHFIARAESRREALRNSAQQTRPEWLTEIAADLAELFQPHTDVARAGFQTELTEAGWELTLFLGATEHVGGPNDGTIEQTSFHFDVLGLLRYFEEIEHCTWQAGPSDDALLIVRGIVEGQVISIHVKAVPPTDAAVGLKVHSDGQVEAT